VWGSILCKTSLKRPNAQADLQSGGVPWHKAPSAPVYQAAGMFVTFGPHPWHYGGYGQGMG